MYFWDVWEVWDVDRSGGVRGLGGVQRPKEDGGGGEEFSTKYREKLESEIQESFENLKGRW